MNATGFVTHDDVEKMIETEISIRLEPLVHSKIEQEEEVRFRQLKWVIVFIGLIGLGTFGTLANYLIEKAVDERIERSTENISQTLDFMKFYTASVKVELGSSYTKKEADLIMNYLRRSRDNSDIRYSEEFLAALYQVANSFVSAGQSATIDEIFTMYEREVLASPELVSAFTHHYGQELVASSNMHDDHAGYKAFRMLERVGPGHNIPEISLAYRTLYESTKPNADDTVGALIERATELTERDQTIYLNEIMKRSRSENWMRSVTPEGRAVERVIRTFFVKHGAKLASSFGVDEKVVDAAASGVDSDTASSLARLIASARSKES
jgi:hypothetical protein